MSLFFVSINATSSKPNEFRAEFGNVLFNKNNEIVVNAQTIYIAHERCLHVIFLMHSAAAAPTQ